MTADAQQKAAFRRWARQNHPDVGGDPAGFAAGLQAARDGRWEDFVSGGAGSTDPYAEPHAPGRTIVYVARSVHGVSRIVVAAKKWNERRRTPPRVR